MDLILNDWKQLKIKRLKKIPFEDYMYPYIPITH